jgi:hypothetical protein
VAVGDSQKGAGVRRQAIVITSHFVQLRNGSIHKQWSPWL